ncbi:MAG: hypothetical protein OEX10_04975 [Candidatus Bathyarchaeota archaeon]|nr:hypothetical protein [Candidatus Bathyarchaeota archaeon]
MGPVVGAILLGIPLFTGRLESTDTIIVAIIMSIVDGADIPIGEEVKNNFKKPEPAAPDGEGEE